MRHQLIARRKALGFTQQSLAHAVPCERSTVSRWERGESDVAPYHRAPLATQLQVSLTELDALLNGAEPALAPGWANVFVTLEQTATSLRNWEPLIMPGLLQTRQDAHAILRDDHLVNTRLARQGALARDNDPLEMTAVIDESVLHRPIGGRHVLDDQLRHLVKLGDRANVTIHVLPLDAPQQPMFFGALLIFGFPWARDGMAYTEHAAGPVFIGGPGEPEAHAARFDQLVDLALSARDSLDLISTRAKELAK